MATTADSVINSVRDLVPDPSGDLFSDTTLYRWCNEAIKLMAKGIGWQVDDWFPMAVTAGQATYSLDAKWHAVKDAFKDRYQLTAVPESAITWPSQSSANRSMWYGVHRNIDHIEINPFPVPSTTDPSTTETGGITSSSTTINVASTTGFLSPGGFVQIGSEIIYYNGLTPTSLTGCQRAQAGTTAATHNDADPVQHMTLWIKGPRAPLEITASTSVVELLPMFIPPLQLYVLANCRRAENEHQEARALMGEFSASMMEIRNDPSWITGNGSQIQPYLGEWENELVFGRLILP